MVIIQKLPQHNSSSVYVFLKDVDAQSIMQYGSEMWGLDKAACECKKNIYYDVKTFLNVDMKTPNYLVHT